MELIRFSINPVQPVGLVQFSKPCFFFHYTSTYNDRYCYLLYLFNILKPNGLKNYHSILPIAFCIKLQFNNLKIHTKLDFYQYNFVNFMTFI